jgi:hypothetical protein
MMLPTPYIPEGVHTEIDPPHTEFPTRDGMWGARAHARPSHVGSREIPSIYMYAGSSTRSLHAPYNQSGVGSATAPGGAR